MILAYALFFGIFTALRHYQFQTQAWDMGIFDQLFWNTINGRFMLSSLEEIPNHFGIHFSPTLLMLVPGYAIFPSPYFLLLMQAAALALGAWPLYLLARKKLRDPFPLIISGAYLLYSPLHWVNNFDFHEIAFFIPLAIAAFYFFEEKKRLAASIFLALAAGTKEDAALIAVFFGIYLLLRAWQERNKPEIKIGIVIILLSTFYFLLATKVIMPAFGGGLLRLDRYHELGGTAMEIIGNSVTNPGLPLSIIFQFQKLKYMLWLFLPAAFLPFFSWPSLFLILPGILENVLTNFPSQFSGHYQYDAVIIPGLFIGMISGLEFLSKKWFIGKEKLLGRIVLIAIFAGFLLRSPISPLLFPLDLFAGNPQRSAISELIAKVPVGASIAAPTNFVPHLTGRPEIYLLGTEPYRTGIVLLDGADLSGFADETQFQNYADSYMNSGNYTYEEVGGRYFIFKRKIAQ